MTDELRREIEAFILGYENNKNDRYKNISNANSWSILEKQEDLLEKAISLLEVIIRN